MQRVTSLVDMLFNSCKCFAHLPDYRPKGVFMTYRQLDKSSLAFAAKGGACRAVGRQKKSEVEDHAKACGWGSRVILEFKS